MTIGFPTKNVARQSAYRHVIVLKSPQKFAMNNSKFMPKKFQGDIA